MGTRKIVADCNYTVLVNSPKTWREYVGTFLAKLAEKVDGRYHLSIRLESLPAMTDLEKIKCLRLSMSHLTQLVKTETQEKTLDVLFGELTEKDFRRK